MKNNLKYKILASFMLLVSLLVVAGTASIIEFIRLSKTVTALLDDNYKTIESSKTMVESLERIDSGLLLFILGEKNESLEILSSADINFNDAFEIAKNNITEDNEHRYIENISDKYNLFKSKWNECINNKEYHEDINWYHMEIHQPFIEAKEAVISLMSLNQNSMYNQASILKDKSHRAIMPGIVAIVGAVIFLLMLNFFINRHYVSPLTKLADAIKDFGAGDKYIRTNINSKYELKKLETEINNLIIKLRNQNKEN
jgi:methyl-accepting chemotaxis protein